MNLTPAAQRLLYSLRCASTRELLSCEDLREVRAEARKYAKAKHRGTVGIKELWAGIETVGDRKVPGRAAA